jgi:hypothetical protein
VSGRAHDAVKAINRWLVAHDREPIDRKQSYELIAQEVIKRFGLDRDTWIKNKHEAKAFVRDVASTLSAD